jgi:hypothetical protein
MGDQAGQSRVTPGVAFPSVGQAVMNYAKADGSNQVFTGSYPVTPGVWSSPNPAAPLAGSWGSWVLTAGTSSVPRRRRHSVRTPKQLNTPFLMQFGDKNLTLTNTTNHLAWFWQPGFFHRGYRKWRLKFSRINWIPTRPARRECTLCKPSRSARRKSTPPSFRYSRFRSTPAIPQDTGALAEPRRR